MKHASNPLLCLFPDAAALAGGSNYGIAPGARPEFTGKASEWAVPTPKFARDPAVAPDGSIFITVMAGDVGARLDPKSRTFKEWDMPPGAEQGSRTSFVRGCDPRRRA